MSSFLTRTLGTQGLSTSATGFGCMGLSQGYGSADDTESCATIQAALESGVTLFDTAMSYGEGHNETLVGAALKSVPRDSVQIATKFGIVRVASEVRLDAHPDRIASYCDASLRRLGVDVIDLYYLHRADPAVPIDESIAAMSALVQAGKVRHLGVSEVTPEQLRLAQATHPIAAVQLEWSLTWREPESSIVPVARELGIGLVAYSPLGRGLLGGSLTTDNVNTSPFRASDPRFDGERLSANLAQAEALTRLAQQWGATPGQLALAWLLSQGDDTVPIPGTRHPSRARENAASMHQALAPDQLATLDRLRWIGDRHSFAVPVTSRPE